MVEQIVKSLGSHTNTSEPYGCDERAEGIAEEVKRKGWDWQAALNTHLHDLGLGKFEDIASCQQVELSRWVELRRDYITQEITKEEFVKRYKQFSEDNEDFLKKEENNPFLESVKFLTGRIS